MSNNKKIILIDCQNNLEKILNVLESYDEYELITFDYDSHMYLSQKNISHITSEKFLKADDFEIIQEQAYHFSNWSNFPKFHKFLNYKDVNIGNLFYIEFFVIILPIIKKFLEVKKIYEKFESHHFVTRGILFDLTKLFSDNVDLFDKNIKPENSFLYDTINIESNFFKIKIPTSYYSKIKKTSEKFFKNFFGIQKKSTNNRIMLVEFNTIRYESLFDSIHNYDLEPIYFGIRRPAIWNKKSYSIIKNTQTKIALNPSVDKEFQLLIDNGVSLMKKNFNELLEKKIFEDFFAIDQKTFWHIIKPYFDKFYQKRLKTAIFDIENSSRILKATKPVGILLLSESGHTEQIILSLAKNMGIHTFLLHHGMFHDTDKGHKWNTFSGSVLVNSDIFLVWGNAMKKYAEHYGISTSKILPVGSPAHDVLLHSKFTKKKSDVDTVLLIAQGPGIHLHAKDYSIKAYDDYYDSIKEICKSVLKLEKNLIIKLHAYENTSNEKKIANEISSKIKVIEKGDTLSLINSCDVFVIIGTSLSTAILEAHILKKPVIRVNFGEWMGEPDALRPMSCHRVSSKDFQNTLSLTLYDNNFRNKLILLGENFLKDYTKNLGTSSDKIASYLSELKHEKFDS